MSPFSRKVSPSESGEPIVRFLQKHTGASGKSLRRSIDKGLCRLNGKIERFHSTPVGPGDVVEIEWVMDATKEVESVYEDNDYLIIDKPAGLRSEDVKMGFLCHRLDKETSGLLLIAKNKSALSEAEKAFKERTIEKGYYAIVEGTPKDKSGMIDSPLKSLKGPSGQAFWGVHPEGLESQTYWEKVKSASGISLLKCYPKTGRTHQIRVHLASIGHPIVGDVIYNRLKGAHKGKRLYLHAYRLKFNSIEIESFIPKEFEELFK